MQQRGAGLLLEPRGCLERAPRSGEEEQLGSLRKGLTG